MSDRLVALASVWSDGGSGADRRAGFEAVSKLICLYLRKTALRKLLDEDRFPEWSLFGPLHPVAEWLDDRLLAHVGRHEAPVLDVPKRPGEAVVALLCQGVISNRRSQPVSVQRFAGGFDIEAQETSVFDLELLVTTAGLDGPLTNPSGGRDVEVFEALLPDTVERA